MRFRIIVRLIVWFTVIGGVFFLFSRVQYPWNWRVTYEYRTLLIKGFYSTLLISSGAIVIGFALGVAGGLARVSKSVIAQSLLRK